MEFLVHGARGSSAASGPEFSRYGGHTTCYSTILEDGHRVILDCGSGLQELLNDQSLDPEAPFEATVFFTHFHWDHIMGLPFFPPVYRPTTKIHFVAAWPDGAPMNSTLDSVLCPPWFPVRVLESGARFTFERVTTRPIRVGDLEVTATALHHPGGVSAYRIEHDGRSLVLATDFETGEPGSDAALRRLAKGATVLVHDAQYLPDELETKYRGWGHSTWEQATAAALDAGVERLVLTSHDWNRTDDAIDGIVDLARGRFPAAVGAYEGQRIEF